MDRLDYQHLRFTIECEIRDALKLRNGSEPDPYVLTNSVMRLLLQAHSSSQVKAQRSKRQFLTFRRSPDVKPPSWAYRKPGIDSRLPTL